MRERDKTAVIYIRTTTPSGWGWTTMEEAADILRDQESECRAYADRHGLLVDSVFSAPYDSPPIGADELQGVGHIIMADAAVAPHLGTLCTFCGAHDIHLHEARSNKAITNWKPPAP